MKAAQLGAVKTILGKVRAFISVAFFGAIIAGLAFVSVKIILNQHSNLTLYREIGYMPDNQTIYWAVGRLSAGLTGVGLSLWRQSDFSMPGTGGGRQEGLCRV